MLLFIVQKTGALIWACQGQERLTTSKEFQTEMVNYLFVHSALGELPTTALLDLTLIWGSVFDGLGHGKHKQLA